MNAHLGLLPYIQFDAQTRACIVGGNHGLHCGVPKEIRGQCSAIGVLPIFCSGIPILYSAPHGITQELRGLFILRMCHHCLSRGAALICLEPCWWTHVLCQPSSPLQQQFIGFAWIVTSTWQCLIEWTFSVSIIRLWTLLWYEKTDLNRSNSLKQIK